MSQNFAQAFFVSEDHVKNYTNVVNNLGLDKLIPHIPFDKSEIQKALDENDIHLNSLPIKLWNEATGIHAHNIEAPTIINGWFFELLKPFDVDSISQSEVVCTLKQAAIMWSKT